MNSTRPVRFKNRVVGQNHPCFVVAEAGVNHNGDIELAKRLVDAAVDARADAVKFQTFAPQNISSDEAPKADYQKTRTGETETMLQMLQRLALPIERFAELKAYCDAAGILFMSTPFDPESVDFLVSVGMPVVKIPSGELTNCFLLRHVAATGLPLFLSTGMATLGEIGIAMDLLRASGSGDVALFQCVSSYPADPASMNLRAIPAMSAAFGVPCGLSDHSQGIELPLAAVALGANMIEKHFTLDRTLPGPDHAMSLEPTELAQMVESIRRVEAALGDGVKRPMPPESEIRAVARRSLAAIRVIEEGEQVGRQDFFALRPGTGLAPAMVEALIGRRARRTIAARALVTLSDFN